ncbi:MAG: hypothetical protein GXN92_03030 [Candidatus Micrarchaeota archaeon]|nr:hypothetical protein [Candidatus Micrarchaeota archaeon]
MQGLPSPLFGGDYYYQQGQIYHYARGGELLESSSLVDAPFSYAPLYGFLVSLLARVLPVLESMKWAAIAIFLLSNLLWYHTLKTILGPWKGLLALLLINSLTWHPVFKYTEFGYTVMLPIFLYFLYKKEWLAVAFLLGLMAYTHGVLFLGVGFLTLAALIRHPKAFPYFFLTVVIILPLVWVYWETGLEPKFPRYKMDFPDFSNPEVWGWFLKYSLEKLLLEWHGWIALLLLYFGIEKKDLTWLLAAFIATFSFVITEPLFHINFFPTYMLSLLFFPILVISVVGLAKVPENLIWVVVIVAALFNLWDWNEKVSDPFFQVAYQPLPEDWLSLQAYLLENASVDSVIITTKEIGFAVNALTGAKLITGRWAHNTNTPYVDMPLRDTETAIILYGNNLSHKLELLEKWGADYIFWHITWPSTEFVDYVIPRNAREAAAVIYNPLFTTNPDYKYRLMEEGVITFDVEMWLDPSVREWYVRTFNTTVVSWQNYDISGYGVWRDDLDPYLEPVWTYYYQGRPIAILYKIKGGTG